MRVLIVEDHTTLANMLKRAFEEKGHAAVVAPNGRMGMEIAAAGALDVLLLDLMLPDFSGLEIVRRLRAEGNRVPILILTAKDTVGDMVSLLDAGADDYLTKPFALAELMARARAMARRGPIEQPALLECGGLKLDLASGQVEREGQVLSLTRTERLVLEVLLRNYGRPVTRRRILEAVWGSDSDTGENTLEAFIKLLRAKVDEPYEQKLIQTVRGIGYRVQEVRGA